MWKDFKYPARLATRSFCNFQMNSKVFPQICLRLYVTRRRVALVIVTFRRVWSYLICRFAPTRGRCGLWELSLYLTNPQFPTMRTGGGGDLTNPIYPIFSTQNSGRTCLTRQRGGGEAQTTNDVTVTGNLTRCRIATATQPGIGWWIILCWSADEKKRKNLKRRLRSKSKIIRTNTISIDMPTTTAMLYVVKLRRDRNTKENNRPAGNLCRCSRLKSANRQIRLEENNVYQPTGCIHRNATKLDKSRPGWRWAVYEKVADIGSSRRSVVKNGVGQNYANQVPRV